MSFSETIFLFFLALIIFGPKKLPEIARQVGKALNEFKRASNEFKAQIEQEISHLEVENKQTILPPSEPPEGATSRSRYADAELHHVEVPALTATASEVVTASGESPSSEAVASPAVSGDATADHSASEPQPVAAEQNSPSAADPSEAVTASDPVGAAVTQESHSSEPHPSESHA